MHIYYDSDQPLVRIIFRNQDPITTTLRGVVDDFWIRTDDGVFDRKDVRDVSLEDDSAPFHIDDWMAAQR